VIRNLVVFHLSSEKLSNHVIVSVQLSLTLCCWRFASFFSLCGREAFFVFAFGVLLLTFKTAITDSDYRICHLFCVNLNANTCIALNSKQCACVAFNINSSVELDASSIFYLASIWKILVLALMQVVALISTPNSESGFTVELSTYSKSNTRNEYIQ